eukprot:4079463-Pyramimonas_sp.AAC.1
MRPNVGQRERERAVTAPASFVGSAPSAPANSQWERWGLVTDSDGCECGRARIESAAKLVVEATSEAL